MPNQSEPGYTKGFVLGALIGGTIGGLAALLLAPKSGEELRKDLADRSEEMYDKASNYFSDIEGNVGSAVSTTVNEGRMRAESIINRARNQAEEILENAETILKEAKGKANSAKEQVQEKIDNLRDAAKASAEAFKSEMSSASGPADE